jgi:hypothetical protein
MKLFADVLCSSRSNKKYDDDGDYDSVILNREIHKFNKPSPGNEIGTVRKKSAAFCSGIAGSKDDGWHSFLLIRNY